MTSQKCVILGYNSHLEQLQIVELHLFHLFKNKMFTGQKKRSSFHPSITEHTNMNTYKRLRTFRKNHLCNISRKYRIQRAQIKDTPENLETATNTKECATTVTKKERSLEILFNNIPLKSYC